MLKVWDTETKTTEVDWKWIYHAPQNNWNLKVWFLALRRPSPTNRGFLSPAQFLRTQERPCLNWVVVLIAFSFQLARAAVLSLLAVHVAQRAKLWPSVFHKRMLPSDKTVSRVRENKINCSRGSGCGDLKGLKRLRQSLLFCPSIKGRLVG